MGSWDALAALDGAEEPLGAVTAVDCSGCYIRSDGLQVAPLGLQDLIVVASGDRPLIVPRGRSQDAASRTSRVGCSMVSRAQVLVRSRLKLLPPLPRNRRSRLGMLTASPTVSPSASP